MPPLAFAGSNQDANTVFNQINSLNAGEHVLVGFEYGPTAAGELDSVSDVLIRHILAKGATPIIASSNPVAIVHAQNIIQDIERSVAADDLILQANQDYYIVRYLAGGTLGLRDLSQNFNSIVSVDAKGDPTNLAMTSLDEMALMVVIAERSDDIRAWAEQIAPTTRTKLIAATGYAAQPFAEPYVDRSEGVMGLIVGYRDAFTYGEMLQSSFVTSTPAPTATFTETSTLSPVPTDTPTPIPSETPLPSDTPEGGVQVVPTDIPTDIPTELPTETPTDVPTETSTPTVTPTATNTATSTPSPSPTPKLITVIVVTAPDASVNVRTGPSVNFPVLTVASTGSVFQVIGENDDGSWINFLLPDGREGWIAAFLVEKTELPEAELEGDASDDSADAGTGVSVMRVEYNRRMGKNRVRYYLQNPTETPIAEATPTATPDPLANFALSRNRGQEGARLNAMTLGTIAAVIIILFGNIYYGLRWMAQRRRESRR